VNWKLYLVILGLAAVAFGGILGLESLAQVDTDSPIGCYVGLASDITPLIGSADTAASRADCLAQLAAVERK